MLHGPCPRSREGRAATIPASRGLPLPLLLPAPPAAVAQPARRAARDRERIAEQPIEPRAGLGEQVLDRLGIVGVERRVAGADDGHASRVTSAHRGSERFRCGSCGSASWRVATWGRLVRVAIP